METLGILFLRVMLPLLSCATIFCLWHCCGLTLFFWRRSATTITTFWRSFGTSFGGAELLRLAVMR